MLSPSSTASFQTSANGTVASETTPFNDADEIIYSYVEKISVEMVISPAYFPKETANKHRVNDVD